MHAACLAAALFLHPLGAAADTVTVYAAASLRGVVEPIGAAFEAVTGHTIRPVFAGSSALARQIEAGAPADVFISANKAWMDHLAADAHVTAPTIVAGNRLALVAFEPIGGTDRPDTQSPRSVEPNEPAGSAGPSRGHERAPVPGPRVLTPEAVRETVGDALIATALVDAVPAGIYARQSLTRLGLWDRLRRQLVQTADVRAALALAARGETAFAVVYRTDRPLAPVHLVGLFPADSHDPIRYPAATLAGAGPAADAFVAFLTGPAATAILTGAGFTTP